MKRPCICKGNSAMILLAKIDFSGMDNEVLQSGGER
jgi:hypothetical protein